MQNRKFKKIFGKNEKGYSHEAIYDYRGFQLQNRLINGSYGCWKGWGRNPKGEYIQFDWINTRDQVADQIDNHLNNPRPEKSSKPRIF